MGLSGKLAAETNRTADGSAVLKYQPPPEARVCKKPLWQLFCFKGKEEVGQPINLNQTAFYMFGKDRKVADIPTDHPSCSRQHAVLVFRWVCRRLLRGGGCKVCEVGGRAWMQQEVAWGAGYAEHLHTLMWLHSLSRIHTFLPLSHLPLHAMAVPSGGGRGCPGQPGCGARINMPSDNLSDI